MEVEIRNKLLNSIERIYSESKACGLEVSIFEKLEEELNILASYLGTTKIQAFFVAIIFVGDAEGETLDFAKLSKHFDSGPMKILYHTNEFDGLYETGILIKRRRRKYHGSEKPFFELNNKVSDAILQGQTKLTLTKLAPKNIFEALEEINLLIFNSRETEMDSGELMQTMQEKIEQYGHFPFLKWINSMGLTPVDKAIYMYLTWEALMGNMSIRTERILSEICDYRSQSMKYKKELTEDKNQLVIKDLAKINNVHLIEDLSLSLSKKSLSKLNELSIKIETQFKPRNIIEAKDIAEHELVFDGETAKQLDFLTNLLSKEHFQEIQQRLEQKKMNKGLTALLYGPPGTGKTESVFQYAKKTGRDIIQVDISSTKSKWFGESEKLIKRVFDQYKMYAAESELVPILLFNEADGIISKRSEGNGSNVSKTENTIQNIIMQELEDFEGIFFATTNLANNMDSAFERRFLFKVEFNNPSSASKVKIWRAKLPWLSEDQGLQLAENYNFSGGQINNIVKKCELHEVIQNKTVDAALIQEFCNNELIEKNKHKKIGF